MATPSTDPHTHRRVESPCIRNCTLDEDDVCLGCFRDITEICAWAGADDDERRRILDAAAARASARGQGA